MYVVYFMYMCSGNDPVTINGYGDNNYVDGKVRNVKCHRWDLNPRQ